MQEFYEHVNVSSYIDHGGSTHFFKKDITMSISAVACESNH